MVSRVVLDGLETLKFDSWKITVQELEYEVLNCLIAKSAQLKPLSFSGMHNTQIPVREAIKYTLLKIIELAPPLTNLTLQNLGLDSASGDEICAALIKSRITTLTEVEFELQSGWFDSEARCDEWANFLRGQESLEKLEIYDCELEGGRKSTIEAAVRVASPNANVVID